MKSSVLDTVYFDFPKGDSSCDYNLLVLYVAVLIFDTIGRSGSRSTWLMFMASSFDSLCLLAVP